MKAATILLIGVLLSSCASAPKDEICEIQENGELKCGTTYQVEEVCRITEEGSIKCDDGYELVEKSK